jgi:c-di-GMP-related signal transduction protein
MSHALSIAAMEKGSEAAPPAAVDEIRSLTRQPILNGNHRVHGYLLNVQPRPDPENGGDVAPGVRRVLDDAVIFGIGRLTDGLPAFVTCSTESLTEE